VKSRCLRAGLALRRRLLIAAGLPRAVVEGEPPKGPARRSPRRARLRGHRAAHPRRDREILSAIRRLAIAYGLPMAIWA
jgi:hypothetical protein